MAFHVPNEFRVLSGPMGSGDSIGNNGLFMFKALSYTIQCVASDGLGWEHVSVSLVGSKSPPNWVLMCRVKEAFWDEEDVVVQFHPKKSQYVNFHPGCLHLWRKIDFDQPTPDSMMVGPKMG